MTGRLDRVQVSVGSSVVTIPWASRDALLDRLADAPELQPITVKQRGVTPEVRQAPNTGYASLLVDGTNIAYVYRQTRAGLRVAPAATLDDLKGVTQKRPFAVRKERSKRFAVVAVAATEKDVPVIADVLRAAAQRDAAARA